MLPILPHVVPTCTARAKARLRRHAHWTSSLCMQRQARHVCMIFFSSHSCLPSPLQHTQDAPHPRPTVSTQQTRVACRMVLCRPSPSPTVQLQQVLCKSQTAPCPPCNARRTSPPDQRSTTRSLMAMPYRIVPHALRHAVFAALLEPVYVRVFSIAVPSPWPLHSSCRITSSASLHDHIRPV